MRLPPETTLDQPDSHRLIPSRHSDGGDSVLTRIADDERHLQDLFDLDSATNDRLLAEHDLLPGIGLGELVLGVPYARIINAAFTHAHPLGSRFNGPERGAWYAGFEQATAIAEIVFHTSVALAEIDLFEDDVTYDDYLADFRGSLHDLRGQPAFEDCLAPDSYEASQALSEGLLQAGSVGVVYPSVRHAGGTCVACFRPALVTHVRKGQTLRFTWRGDPQPEVNVL